MAEKILLVDDEEFIHKIIRRVFEGSPYELFSAYNGNEALAKARELAPDLILLDINMPEKDGYAVVRDIRSNKKTKRIPIIMVTALGEVVDKVVGYELGVEDYITKPFDGEKFRKRIEIFLKKIRTSSG